MFLTKSVFSTHKKNLKPIILFFTAMLMLFAVLLCSCGSRENKKSATLQTRFCKKFSAEYDGTEFIGKVDCAETAITFTLDSPDTLSGTKLTVDKTSKSMSANVYGMEFKLDDSKYPQAAFAAAFADAVCGASKNAGSFSDDGKIEGDSDGLKYIITADDNGEISEIAFKNIPLKITLSPC